jgi:starch phosphorylase
MSTPESDGRTSEPEQAGAQRLRPVSPPMDKEGLADSLAGWLNNIIGKDQAHASQRDWYNALALTVRERLMARWIDTEARYRAADAKRLYYLSLEFLLGRSLTNATLNLDLEEPMNSVLKGIGLDLEALTDQEIDAGLGNGGLGRLAACFLDSLATLDMPGFGHGIRYDYGMFTQEIGKDGEQIERPTLWLRYRNFWEIVREDRVYPVRFGGRVQSAADAEGTAVPHWEGGKTVYAVAYDTLIPGAGGRTVNHLRLWSGRAVHPFDLDAFNDGDFTGAVADQVDAKNLSRVLYPDDTTELGKELRLKQQYFFVSASLQDIVRDYKEIHGSLDQLPQKVAIQLNDTHPALAIPELMRILLDEHNFGWDKAWSITSNVFSYTNHTLLPEALETWPVRMFEKLLPRHLHVIYRINRKLLDELDKRYPQDYDRHRRMSLIGEEDGKRVRMANLGVVGSHRVNGVAALHTRIMRETIFRDFDEFYPNKIVNVTNGVTPRRWLMDCNLDLMHLIRSRIGRDWECDLAELAHLAPYADDEDFRNEFAAVKHSNKERLAALIHEQVGITVSPDSMFDVQIKRIHEYKRQLLNVLYVITRYNRIRKNPDTPVVPRTVIFAGKAAPGYLMAKAIIKLINKVADWINNDPMVGEQLKMVFLPDYSVSLAEKIVPAADLSQQISTAGMEASGTGNMKLAMNGALTIGTLDGANVEIRDAVGEDNIFIFGLTAEQVAERRRAGYVPAEVVKNNPELVETLAMINDGYFSPSNLHEFGHIVDNLLNMGEHYLVLDDFADYAATQDRVDALFSDPDAWMRKAILNTAKVGRFSSDRSITEYARNIWGLKPVPPAAS